MNVSLALDLATPQNPADRRRARLMTTGVAGSGMFALAAVAIATLRGADVLSESGPDAQGVHSYVQTSGPLSHTLAPFLAEPGLRGGATLAAALVVLPFLMFAFQALRIGSAARERRLAALSLAGATRRDLRAVAVLEGTRAAVRGGVLAGGAYLVLWLVLGVALPDRTKLLPPLQWEVLAAWPAVVVLLALAGAAAGALSARPATITPLGVTRRIPRRLGVREAVLPLLALVALFTSEFSYALGVYLSRPALVSLTALVVLGLTAGPWLVLAAGSVAARSGNVLTAMAGQRLLADVRTPGRLGGFLLLVGVGFGVLGVTYTPVPAQFQAGNYLYHLDHLLFYVAGGLLVAALLLVTGVLAVWSMVAGATEQVLENRRATATVVALAASPRIVLGVVRRQLLLATLPSTVLGALLALASVFRTEYHVGVLPGLVVAVVVAVLGTLVATAAVAPAVRESAGPENLRVA